MGPRVGVDRSGKPRPPTGIRSPDRPVRSELLYRLNYPCHRGYTIPNTCQLQKLQPHSFLTATLRADGRLTSLSATLTAGEVTSVHLIFV